MLLSAAGLLRGRTATTNRGAHDQLRAAGTIVRDERVVDDGAVITAGGPSCGIDLALWLTEREAGPDIAARNGAGHPVRMDALGLVRRFGRSRRLESRFVSSTQQ